MIIASPLAALMVPMVLVTTPLSAVAPNQTPASMTALRQWVEAVNDHLPGEPDAAVRYVAGMTYSARVELNKLSPLFIKVLQENFVVSRSEIDSDVAALARTVRQRPGSAAFLKRATCCSAPAGSGCRRKIARSSASGITRFRRFSSSTAITPTLPLICSTPRVCFLTIHTCCSTAPRMRKRWICRSIRAQSVLLIADGYSSSRTSWCLPTARRSATSRTVADGHEGRLAVYSTFSQEHGA